MASAAAAAPVAAPEQLSAAQKLAQEHAEHAAEGHHVTVEDVVDEDLNLHVADSEPSSAPVLSEKASGKQKEASPATATSALDTQSRELFPDLGGPKSQATTKTVPKWNVLADKSNGQAQNGTSRAATPSSGAATPTGNPAVPSVSLPGRKNVETIALRPQHMKPRDQLRRPLPDIIKDINRTSRANISIASTSNGITFEATGPQDAAQRALKDLVNQIGTPVSLHASCHQVVLRNHIANRWSL